MEGYTQNSTLRDYLRVIFRFKAVIITSVVTVMVTVFFGLKFKTPVYESSVKMLISAEKQVDSPYYRELMGYRDVQLALTQSEIVKSNPVIGLTVRALGLWQRPLNYEKNFATIFKKPFIIIGAKRLSWKLRKFTDEQKNEILYRLAIDTLKQSINVEPVRDTNMFVVKVRDFSPVGSTILANAVSRAYVIFDLQQQLSELQLKYGDKHPTTVQLKDNIDKMAKNLNGQPLPDVEAIGPASVKVIEQATIPDRPVGIPPIFLLVLAFFMSVFLGVMLAFMFEYLDPTFKSREDVERTLNIPFLGSIYSESHLEYYGYLADQVYLLMKDKKLKSVLFTSALSGEGVTDSVINLGNALLNSTGNKVLVIDANLRDRAIYSALNLSEGPGLAEVLEGKTNLDKAIQKTPGGLSVLTVGKTNLNPVTLLGSSMMSDILKQAKERYEIVLLDCADLKTYKDAIVLSSLVDAIVLIISEGKARRPVVKDLITPLEQRGANIIGAVLSNRKFVIPKALYDKF